jgi:hypothetical protein
MARDGVAAPGATEPRRLLTGAKALRGHTGARLSAWSLPDRRCPLSRWFLLAQRRNATAHPGGVALQFLLLPLAVVLGEVTPVTMALLLRLLVGVVHPLVGAAGAEEDRAQLEDELCLLAGWMFFFSLLVFLALLLNALLCCFCYVCPDEIRSKWSVTPNNDRLSDPRGSTPWGGFLEKPPSKWMESVPSARNLVAKHPTDARARLASLGRFRKRPSDAQQWKPSRGWCTARCPSDT